MTAMLSHNQTAHAVEALAMCGLKARACRRYQDRINGHPDLINVGSGGYFRPILNADTDRDRTLLDDARADLHNKVDATDHFFIEPLRSAALSADEVISQASPIAAVVYALSGFGIETMLASAGMLLGFAGTITVAVVPSPGGKVAVHAINCDRRRGILAAATSEGVGTALDEVLSTTFSLL